MLVAAGYRPGTMEDALRGKRRVLHVTFDDGFKSILQVYPLLRSMGIPLTVFVCSRYDGNVTIPELAADAAARPDQFAALAWDDLRELAREGVEVGSHGLNHRRFTGLSDRELREELTESKHEIEHEIGQACRYVAYPYGDYDHRTMRAAKNAGFVAGCTMSSGPLQRTLLSVPRIGVYPRDTTYRVRAKTLLPIRLTRQAIPARRQRP